MTAGVILAGGRARRMGGLAKGRLPVGGTTIVERTLALLRARCDELLVVANDAAYDDLGVRVVPDAPLGARQGPLAGLYTALVETGGDPLLVLACDMPSVRGEVLDLLLATAPGADAVVPVVGGRPEPLIGRYARRCLPAVRARLEAGRLKLQDLLGDLAWAPLDEAAIRAVDPELASLRNVNAPPDLV